MLTTALLTASIAPAAPDDALAARLQARTQVLADAIAPGQKAVWDEATDPALVYISESGEVLDKQKLLADFDPLPAGLVGQIRIVDFHLDRYGNTALTRYVMDESLDYHGQMIKTKFQSSDVWIIRRGQWKLVASHVTVLLNDPPALAPVAATLAPYAGRYRLTDAIHYTIRLDAGGDHPRLMGRRNEGEESELRMEAPDVFFVAGRPRSRKVFFRDASGNLTGFGDRRDGNDIVWTREGSQ